MAHNLYLTDNELRAIESLAKTDSYSALRTACDIPDYGVHMFAAELRRKTGIHNSRSPSECAAYLERYRKSMENTPTAEQLYLLNAFAKGDDNQGISYQVTLSRGLPMENRLTAADIPLLMDRAFEAVGIFTRDDKTRRKQLMLYFATQKPEDVLFPQEERFLRLWASGSHPLEIVDMEKSTPEYVKSRIKIACRKLGILSKGKGVQRALAKAYFAHKDAQTPVTMDDPAF